MSGSNDVEELPGYQMFQAGHLTHWTEVIRNHSKVTVYILCAI